MNSNQMDSAQRIKAIDPGMAKGKAKELLDAVVKKYGAAPNSFKTMANSPAVLQGFLGLSGTLEGGVLAFETRYQIAIAVSEINGCPYCLSAFTAIGKGAGMKDETRSEEHTSELQSRVDLVCRLLLEKKKEEINTDSGKKLPTNDLNSRRRLV